MDETSLRTLFERAVATRPQTPYLVANSLRAGKRIRRRRRVGAAAASMSAVALIAVITPLASGTSGIGSRAEPSVTGQAGLTAYVASGNKIVPLRLASGRELAPMRFTGAISAMASSANGKWVYVLSRTPPGIESKDVQYVTRIDAATASQGRRLRLTGGPAYVQAVVNFQVAPGGKVAYASEAVLDGNFVKYGLSVTRMTNVIEAINLVTGAEHKLLEATGFPGAWGLPLAITPDFRTAYVAGLPGEVVPIDLTTQRALAPIEIKGPDSSGIAIAPDGRTAYVASFNDNSSDSPAWVTPIDTATNRTGAPIEVGERWNGPNGYLIAIAPDGKAAYVSGGPVVTPIDLTTFKALPPIRLPFAAFKFQAVPLVMSPDGAVAWVSSAGGPVQLIDFASGAALRPIVLPAGYFVTGGAAFVPSGRVLFLSAAASRGRAAAATAVFPISIASQRPGKLIPISEVGEIVIAG